jgi:GTPase SAR1 family protein
MQSAQPPTPQPTISSQISTGYAWLESIKFQMCPTNGQEETRNSTRAKSANYEQKPMHFGLLLSCKSVCECPCAISNAPAQGSQVFTLCFLSFNAKWLLFLGSSSASQFVLSAAPDSHMMFREMYKRLDALRTNEFL